MSTLLVNSIEHLRGKNTNPRAVHMYTARLNGLFHLLHFISRYLYRRTFQVTMNLTHWKTQWLHFNICCTFESFLMQIYLSGLLIFQSDFILQPWQIFEFMIHRENFLRLESHFSSIRHLDEKGFFSKMKMTRPTLRWWLKSRRVCGLVQCYSTRANMFVYYTLYYHHRTAITVFSKADLVRPIIFWDLSCWCTNASPLGQL